MQSLSLRANRPQAPHLIHCGIGRAFKLDFRAVFAPSRGVFVIVRFVRQLEFMRSVRVHYPEALPFYPDRYFVQVFGNGDSRHFVIARDVGDALSIERPRGFGASGIYGSEPLGLHGSVLDFDDMLVIHAKSRNTTHQKQILPIWRKLHRSRGAQNIGVVLESVLRRGRREKTCFTTSRTAATLRRRCE